MRGHSDASRLFSLAQRLGMSKLLEDNKARAASGRFMATLALARGGQLGLLEAVCGRALRVYGRGAQLLGWRQCAYLVRERAASSS